MIRNEDILSLNYYTYGQPFTGSDTGMRYRVIMQKEEKSEDGTVIKEKGLIACVWPEPFSFEKTADEQKITKLFPFTEEGKEQAAAWMNEMHDSLVI